MAFYGERFRRPDEEDIWEELRQMLINSDALEAEKKLQEARELEAFNRAWDEANGVGVETTSQAEPYLTYEELMDGIEDKTLHGQPTGMAVPVQKGYVTNVKPTPYEEIDAKLDWSEDFKAQKKSEVKAIQEAARVREKEINREHLLEQAKNYGGAALELGSVFVPGYGGAKVAGTLAKKLAPTVGRKIAKEIATGTLKGASSGTLEGLGRGLLEDENPLKTAIQDTAIGTTLGAGLGMAGANVEKSVRGNNLKKIDDLKLLRKKETDFYKDYIQGTKSRHPQIGDIDYTQSGLETVSKQPNAGRDFDSLKKDLNNAEYIDYELPYHKNHGVKDNIRGFHKLKNNNKEFLIADTPDGAKYYMSKQIGDVSNRPSRVEPTSPNNIIPPVQQNLNPTTSGTQPNKPIPTLESEEEWLKRLRRQRQRRGFF